MFTNVIRENFHLKINTLENTSNMAVLFVTINTVGPVKGGSAPFMRNEIT